MGLRRCSLLMLGVALSMLTAVVLLFSVKNTSVSAANQTGSMQPHNDLAEQMQSVIASPAEPITLPASIHGTTLVAQRLAAYDGPFLEDGSGQEVVNIAALVVYNAGDREVLQTGITLQWEAVTLCFYAENIPPGKAVLLLERNRRSCAQNEFTACSGWQVSARETRDPAAFLEITDSAMGAVTVTNITSDTLQDVRLCYKSWLSPPDIYIGGISRQMSVSALQPGESTTLYPPYYARGYTKIVSVSVNSQ